MEYSERLKINSCNYALYVFILIPFLRPVGLEVTILPSLNNIFIIWVRLSMFLFILLQIAGGTSLIIKSKDEFRFMKLYSIYIFINSVVLKFLGNNKIPFFSCLFFCAYIFIIIYIACKNYEMLLDILYKYLYLINILNAIFIVVPIVPTLNNIGSDGLYYFIGHRQAVSMVWLLSIFLCLIKNHSIKKKNKLTSLINTILYIGIATFNLIVVIPQVATGFFVCSVFVILYIIMIVFKKSDSVNNIAMYLIFLGGLVINYLIITFNVQDYFAEFLFKYLGESASLNGRTVIYRAFYKAYKNSKIFGYGYSGVRVSVRWGRGWNSLGYAHNTILQELTNGGIVEFVLFCIMGLYAIHNACKTKDLYIKKVVLCTLAAQMTIMITEPINNYNYEIMLLLYIL